MTANICEDSFSPHARLRVKAGKEIAARGGTICSMTSSGSWSNARLDVVWTMPDGKRWKTRLSCVVDDPVVHIRRFEFDKVSIPTTVAQLQNHTNWVPWLLRRIASLGGFNMNGWRYAFHSHCKGVSSAGRKLLEEFAERVLLDCYQSGWCENEKDEAEYLKAVLTLEADIRSFEF